MPGDAHADLTVRIDDSADQAVRVVGDQVLDIAGAAAGELVTVEAGNTLGTRTLAEAGIQPADSDLAAIAALSTTSFGRSLLTLANAAAGLTAFGAQASDADLTAIAALSTTTFGRDFLTLADHAALVTKLALVDADIGGTRRAQVITFAALFAAQSWTDMPLAETELQGSTRNRMKVDLTQFTQARMSIRTTAAGATGAQMRAQYSTDQVTWHYLDGATGPAVAIDSANSTLVSAAWVNLEAGAKADVFLRIVGVGGDGAVDPSFNLITLQVR